MSFVTDLTILHKTLPICHDYSNYIFIVLIVISFWTNTCTLYQWSSIYQFPSCHCYANTYFHVLHCTYTYANTYFHVLHCTYIYIMSLLCKHLLSCSTLYVYLRKHLLSCSTLHVYLRKHLLPCSTLHVYLLKHLLSCSTLHVYLHHVTATQTPTFMFNIVRISKQKLITVFSILHLCHEFSNHFLCGLND